MKFELTKEQIDKWHAWQKEVARKGVDLQKKKWAESGRTPDAVYLEYWEMGFPYTGAIGGSYSFIFTPTSLGLITKVVDGLTEEELDLTDYSEW